MKNKFFILLTSLLVFASAYAQKTIAVLTGNNWTFYTDFSTALSHCAAGSTIYLPGGAIYISGGKDTIDKQVNIIGVGHYPDSTLATQPTFLDGSLYFLQTAANCSLSGFSSYEIRPAELVNNIHIDRLKLQSFIINEGSLSTDPHFSNFNINDCIINVIGSNASYYQYNNDCTGELRNNIIGSLIGLYSISVINNQIGVLGSWNTIFGGYNGKPVSCSFINNIISTPTDGGGNVFQNNVFFSAPYDSSASSSFAGNISSQTFSSTFINAPSFVFSYSYDYHLKSNSPAINAGTDGTDIGIYGSSYPYKPSAVPANPHISTKSISPSSAPNGTLPINIRVIAQDR